MDMLTTILQLVVQQIHHQRTKICHIPTSWHVEMLGSGIAMWQICCTRSCRIAVSLSVGGVVQYVTCHSRCPCGGVRHLMFSSRLFVVNNVTVSAVSRYVFHYFFLFLLFCYFVDRIRGLIQTRKHVDAEHRHDTRPSVQFPSVWCSGADSKLGLTMA